MQVLINEKGLSASHLSLETLQILTPFKKRIVYFILTGWQESTALHVHVQ